MRGVNKQKNPQSSEITTSHVFWCLDTPPFRREVCQETTPATGESTTRKLRKFSREHHESLKHPLIMPPRLYLLSIPRTIAFRPKAPVSAWRNERTTRILPLCRNFADSKDPPAAGRSKNIDTQSLPHVSEEAAKRVDITGSKGPEIEQRTPVEEVRRIDDAHR